MRNPNDRWANPKAPSLPTTRGDLRHDPREEQLEENHHRRLHARLGRDEDHDPVGQTRDRSGTDVG